VAHERPVAGRGRRRGRRVYEEGECREALRAAGAVRQRIRVLKDASGEHL
jgi:hypothetical protein